MNKIDNLYNFALERILSYSNYENYEIYIAKVALEPKLRIVREATI